MNSIFLCNLNLDSRYLGLQSDASGVKGILVCKGSSTRKAGSWNNVSSTLKIFAIVLFQQVHA